MTYPFFRHSHTVTYPGTTVTYTYDPMGNRLSMATTAGNTSSSIAYTYDAGDRLLSAGTTTYTYDNNGNLPWGPSCSTFITYPAGMVENAPKDSAFVGPQDPTQNRSLPLDMMAIGIPAGLAIRMAENLDSSFAVRRPEVAFPRREMRKE